jgi:hypothetical protein
MSLGDCIVLATDTYLDDNNILRHTLQVSCSQHLEDSNVFKVSEICTYIRRDKSSHGPPAKPNLPLPPELRHPLEEHVPFRAILLPPKSVPPKSIRLPIKSTQDARQRVRAFPAKVRFASPDSNAPTTAPIESLNLDQNGKPLTYSSTKCGPDKIHWEQAETVEIIRLIQTGTFFPIAHSRVPQIRSLDQQ